MQAELPDPVTARLSVKAIESNQINGAIFFDYPMLYGIGIETLDAEELLVSDNAAREFDAGAIFNYSLFPVNPVLELYRNQIRYNQSTNVTINAVAPGIIRSYYNVIGNSAALPGINYVRPPWTIGAFNLDVNGVAP